MALWSSGLRRLPGMRETLLRNSVTRLRQALIFSINLNPVWTEKGEILVVRELMSSYIYIYISMVTANGIRFPGGDF